MITTLNPNFKEYVRLKIKRNKFNKAIGMDITKIEVGWSEAEIPFREMHEQQNGFFHGGVIATLCDIVCGFSVYSLVKEGDQVFTVESKVSYLRKGKGEKLRGVGRVIKAGKRFHFCEAEVYAVKDGQEKLIAKASSTMGVVDESVNDKYGD